MNKTPNTLEMPVDIKFVNGLTSVLFGVFLFLLALSSIEYFFKNKIKNLDAIAIKGNILHSDISSIRNHITSNINGNFYSINLNQTKKIFENIPWVNQAVVKRVYPSQIEVKLSEYKSKAIWGTREDMRLVDETGVIFEANTEDDEYDLMPQLIGPEGQGKLMLDMYKNISIALSPLNMKLKILELNARGSWVAILEGGAHFELGRGNVTDIIDRISKFATGAEQMLTKLNKKVMDIQYIDLRHSEGYALRIHGISTLDLSAGTTSLKK
jgi:cell division protein FtsQ